MLDNITPETLSMLDNEYLNSDNSGTFHKKIMSQLYSESQSKSIIQILDELRYNGNNDVYESINEHSCRIYDRPLFTKNNNKITLQFTQVGTIESVIVADPNKITRIKIYSDANIVLFDSFDKIDLTKTAKYKIYQENESQIRTGLLLSNYNIPFSVNYYKIYMDIEFDDAYVLDNIDLMIIYAILNDNHFNLLQNTAFELDTQPGKFIIFHGGMFGEHFTRDDGDLAEKYYAGTLSDKYKKLFDEAHAEAEERKGNIIHKLYF